ncbi:RimK family alpha-L-glutamate ligase [Prauserella oleivorans]|uniref:RimK family alpha-L-glutamate ligase n=1 Tax=Prauserella oleivorans TaxID=1478153 RepID=A0ABW5W6F8_9PSEU
MTARAIFVGCAHRPEGNGDDDAAVRALADIGVATRWAVWDDPAEDVASADVVILRATWDYPLRRDEFLAWCASVPRLRNPFAAVRWNTDKSYLLDLERAGVPIVPTRLVHPGTVPEWPEGEFVLKPAVGAGSVGAARFAAGEHERAAEHLRSLHDRRRTALLQPYQAAVDSEGETALVFFGGQYSHAFTKGPMLTGAGLDGSGLYVAEKRGTTTPSVAWRALAEDTLDAAAAHLGLRRGDLLYARVDVVRTDAGTPALLELEVTEPSLGFGQADEAAALRFASAVRGVLA